ncbi:MAG: SDR family NAD(P)-dependent oxidoreductase [Thermoplasmata archaeon]
MAERETPPKPLTGKSGWVTGAGRGIGRAIALHLADLGADVGVNYWHSEEGAKEVVAEIEGRGHRALLLPGDVASESVVKGIVQKVTNELGRVDFLVNNAGGAGGADRDDPIDVENLSDWDRVIASNLTAAFLCTRNVAPQMLRQRSGRIVNISSICALTGDCGPAYSAAKAGLLGLTRHSAVWLAPYVQVNAVLPGFIDSQPHDATKVGRITPGRRMGHPEDVAEFVGYLLSSSHPFLTGSCITLDGGVTNGVISRMMDWDDVHTREKHLMD